MTYKVFISSNAENWSEVRELQLELRRLGIDAITPTDVVLPDLSTEDQLKKMIGSSDCVLVFIGRDGRRSLAMNIEIGAAIASGRLVVPLIEEGSEIPKSLAGIKYIEVSKANPRLSYENTAKYVNELKTDKERKKIIGGLLLAGLSILLLGVLFQKGEK